MNKEWLVKTLALGIVVLLVGVSFQPVFAKDTIPPEKKSDTKELLETIKDLANNQKIQKIIQKYERKRSLLGFQQLRGRLQKEIIGAIKSNDALNERIKQLFDLPCDCENDNNPLRYPKILCFFFICLSMVCFYYMDESP